MTVLGRLDYARVRCHIHGMFCRSLNLNVWVFRKISLMKRCVHLSLSSVSLMVPHADQPLRAIFTES